MELLSTWRTLYTLRFCPVTLIQTAFSAGTVYLLTAMQPNFGTRISLKGLRQSLDEETLVEQYLQEIGLSWDCATDDSDTLRKLKSEQVGPLLDFLDRQSIPNVTADLYIFADIDDGGGKKGSSLPCSSLPGWESDVTDFESGFFPKTPHSTTFFLSTPPKYILTSSTSPNQVPPLSTHLVSKDSSPVNVSSTHAHSFAPIVIRSRGFISKPASFASPWSLLSSEGSSGGQRLSLVHNPQPSGQGLAPKIQPSDQSSAVNIQPSSSPSSRDHFFSGYLSMSGGQALGSVFRWLFQWGRYLVLLSPISFKSSRNWFPWPWTLSSSGT